MEKDLLRVNSCGVNFFALRGSHGLFLIDGGFIGGRRQLDRTLAIKGWNDLPIEGVMVTHGHIDHILNVERIAREHDAWIAAPALDADWYRGHPRYKGAGQITGYLERIAMCLFGFQSFTPHRNLKEGDLIEVWHGLRVIHLPGHTPGHIGLYCEPLKLLFCGDLFASFRVGSHFPPPLFNQETSQIRQSVARVLSLDLEGILPNHSDGAPPATHLERLRKLARAKQIIDVKEG